jgi:hypothetical protein
MADRISNITLSVLSNSHMDKTTPRTASGIDMSYSKNSSALALGLPLFLAEHQILAQVSLDGSCDHCSAAVVTAVQLCLLQCSCGYGGAVVFTAVQLCLLQCSCSYGGAVVFTAVQL